MLQPLERHIQSEATSMEMKELYTRKLCIFLHEFVKLCEEHMHWNTKKHRNKSRRIKKILQRRTFRRFMFLSYYSEIEMFKNLFVRNLLFDCKLHKSK